MQSSFRALVALSLNVLLFIQPLFIYQTAEAAVTPTPRVWDSGKPWTVLREISIKLRDHLNNIQTASARVDRPWLEKAATQTNLDSDVRAACRFWSSPGMFHELEAFAPTDDPSAVALRSPDGWLTAGDLTRWIDSSDAPNSESTFIEFVNNGAFRSVGLSRTGSLDSVPANFFDLLDTPSGKKTITTDTKAAVLFVLTDDMHRFEAGIGAGYWKKYYESGASPADSRASCLSAINRIWAHEDVQTLYADKTKFWLTWMSGAVTGPAQSFLDNGTDKRTADNRLYQSIANHYNQVYSPGRWKNESSSDTLSVTNHAFTVVKSAGFTGSSLLFYAGQIRFYRNLLGAEVTSPLKLASQLGDELQLAMPNSFASIRSRVDAIKDGSLLSSLLRNQLSVEKALTIYFEAVAGYIACLPQTDVDALNASLHNKTSTVLIDELVGMTDLNLMRELFLDSQDNIDPVKVELYLNKLLMDDPNALTMPGLSEPVNRGDVFKVLKVIWDTSLKQPASLLSALDKVRDSKDLAKLFPSLNAAGTRGLLHATSAIIASAALALNASSDPSSITKSPTSIAQLSVGAFKIAVTLGEAASKYATTALKISDTAVLKSYTARLKTVASASKTVGGVANVAAGILGMLGSIQQLSNDRPAAALGITSSILTIIEGLCSAAEGFVTIAGLSGTIGAVLVTVGTIATVISAVALTATIIYGVIQEVNERGRAADWVASLWISTGKLKCGVWLPYVENYQLSGMSGSSTISIGPRDQWVCLRLKSLGKLFEPSDKIYLNIPQGTAVRWLSIPVSKSFDGLGEMVIYVDRKEFPKEDFSLDASANLFKANIYPAGDWLLYGVQSNPLSLRIDSSPPPALSSISQKWTSQNGAVVKTITGQSEAGAIVKASGTLGVLKAVTTAGPDGRWNMDVAWPAEPWPNELWSFSSTDSLGNTSTATTLLMLTRFPPNPPLDTTFTVTSAFSSNTSPLYLQFNGNGSPGHVIEVSHAIGVVGKAVVGQDGKWVTETPTSTATFIHGTSPLFVVIKQFSPEGKLLNTLKANFKKIQSPLHGQLLYTKTDAQVRSYEGLYEDLLSLKVSELQVMQGVEGAAPTGVSTLIDSFGIDTASLMTESLQVTGSTPGVGKVLTSDSNGNATWQSPTTSKDAQTLALSGSSLSISNGNSVTLPDTSSTNELQTLSLSGNSLTLSNGGGTVPLPSAAGTVTQIATGTGLTGGPITSTGTISLADSGAASGTYGSGSAVPVINVDSKGRIKGVSTTPVSNLYNSDGTLSGGRTVTLGGSDLVLSGSTGDLIFASDLIKVYGGRSIEFGADIATKEPNAGKVYYNASGNSTLDITGAGTPNVPRVVRILDNLVVSNSLTVPSVKITSGGPGVGKVLTSDASGNATWQTIAAGTGTQTLSLSGSTLSISNGNSVILPDTSSTNELQTLSLSGNSLTLSNGGGTVTLSSGTVTQIATGTGLTGGPITSTGTISLADSGASAGTYGSGSAVPVVNVDSKGRLTAVSTMPVSNLYNADGMLSSSRIVTMGNHNLSLNGTGNFVFNATSLKMNGSRIMEFGAGIEGKDPFAGMIAYNAFNSNALDIVGAGAISGKRRVRIWDLIETSGLNTHNLTATGLVSATALTVNGIPINGSNLYNSDGTLSSGRTITMGANNLSLVGTGNFVFNAASVKMNGSRFMEFGTGVAGKDGNAGIIGYQVFGKLNALDIVGAGAVSGQRRIKLWDLVETDGLTTAHLTTHNLTATGLVTAPGMWVNGTLTTANLTTHNLTATGLITAPGMWVNGTLTTAHLTTHNLTATGLVSVAALTVNGRQVDGSNLYNSNGSLTGTRAVNFNGNNLLFQGSGRIGIGTHITSPRAPLHVDIGSYDGYISATNHYIDPSIIGGPNNLYNPYHTAITAPWINGNQAVSIFARGHIITESSIACVTGLVWSDERLKVIKGVSDKEKDLGLLKQIQITEYQMKDQVQHGRTVQKKVIAQQVEKILPCAVTLSTQFVPDIYQQGTIRENQVTVAGAIHVKAGDLVRIHVEKDGHEEKLELRASSAGKESFTVESREKLNGKVFVYGVERRDVRSVDYDAIAMLNVSATQELAKQQEATTRELAAVRADRDKLAAKVEAQTTRVEAQAREIDALKKQQAAEIAQINAALEVLSKLVEMKVTDKAAKVVSTKAR